MAIKSRNKPTDNKLVIEAVKPFAQILNDSTFERFSILKSTSRPRPQVSHYSNNPQSYSPPPVNMLEILLAKHSLKSRRSDLPQFQSRPKTVLNLKKKLNLNESTEKVKENSQNKNSLPLCIGKKKEAVLIGEYEIGDELGKGAYGTVRLGTHTLTGEKVAIKSYEKSTLITPSRKKSILREAKILSKLKHSNIVKFLTTIETPTLYNLVFEHVSGCSLKDYLYSRSARKIEEYQASLILTQILQALEFCHSIGVSHRDIKLENVLLEENHIVKLIDFGLSTYIPNKKVQLFCGTLYYMAPEIVLNKESDGGPIDIWACGVLLYVLVTGTFPFKGKTKRELYLNMQNWGFSFPQSLSADLKELLKGVFHNNPQARPTASQILASQWMVNTKSRSLITRTFTNLSYL